VFRTSSERIGIVYYNVDGNTRHMDGVISLQTDILIIGGGFSGTILAVQFLRQSSNVSIAVMERGVLPGRGRFYDRDM
jgi:ribulose 1,5-bisphosphate synthetase/thiazole synthase